MDQDFDRRCRQRLREHLGLDDEALEVIMNLRSQVITLQARLRELESTTSFYHSHTRLRLTHYRETVTEATWIEAPRAETPWGETPWGEAPNEENAENQ